MVYVLALNPSPSKEPRLALRSSFRIDQRKAIGNQGLDAIPKEFVRRRLECAGFFDSHGHGRREPALLAKKDAWLLCTQLPLPNLAWSAKDAWPLVGPFDQPSGNRIADCVDKLVEDRRWVG